MASWSRARLDFFSYQVRLHDLGSYTLLPISVCLNMSANLQGWAKTQNLEKTQKTRVFSRFLGFSLGFFKFGFFQDLH